MDHHQCSSVDCGLSRCVNEGQGRQRQARGPAHASDDA